MMNEEKKARLMEMFKYFSTVHYQQQDLIDRIVNVYAEVLYANGFPDIKEAVENYLNALTVLNTANEEIIAVYEYFIDELGS